MIHLVNLGGLWRVTDATGAPLFQSKNRESAESMLPIYRAIAERNAALMPETLEILCADCAPSGAPLENAQDLADSLSGENGARLTCENCGAVICPGEPRA